MDDIALNGATIAFDLDGTLVESAPDVIGAINAVISAGGYQPLPYDDGRPLISRGARGVMQFALERAGESDAAARTASLFGNFIEYYGAHLAVETSCFPGVEGALSALQDRGAKLVVCTNKPTELSIRLLKALGIGAFFDAVIGIDATTAAKPNPAHLIEAVAAVGGDINRTIMVGDADTDERAARAAGTGLILVSFGYSEVPAANLNPDALLHNFDDLVEACSKLLIDRRASEVAGRHGGRLHKLGENRIVLK